MKLKERFIRIFRAPSMVQYFIIFLLIANSALSTYLLTDIRDYCDSISGDVYDVDRSLIDVASEREVSSLESEISDLKREIEEMSSKVDRVGSYYSVDSSLDDIKKKLESVESDIESLESDVSSIETVVDSMKSSVYNVENILESLRYQ